LKKCPKCSPTHFFSTLTQNYVLPWKKVAKKLGLPTSGKKLPQVNMSQNVGENSSNLVTLLFWNWIDYIVRPTSRTLYATTVIGAIHRRASQPV
jgi:hypothetical protein